jgi:hypothetical protein
LCATLVTLGYKTPKWRIYQTNCDEEAHSSSAKNSPAVDLWAVLRHAGQELINRALDNSPTTSFTGATAGMEYWAVSDLNSRI